MRNFVRRLSAVLAVTMISTVLAVSPSSAQSLLGPVLVSTTPADGASVQEAPTVVATYDRDLATTSTLVVRDKAGDLISGSKTVDGRSITFTPSAPITEAGSPYSATATVSDTTLGTLQTTTSTWSFSIDVTAPVSPTITSVEGDGTSPADGNDTTPTIVVSGVVAGDTVTISAGTTVLGSKVVPTGTTVTFNAVETSTEATVSGDGDHTLTATAIDPAGNTSAASPGFVYALDTGAPAAPAISSVEGDTTSPAAGNDTTPEIVVSGVVTGDTVTVSDGATVLASKVVPAGADTVAFNAAETSGDVTLSGDGDHTLTATATDPVGNTSPASPAFVYALDTTAPAPPTISSVEGDPTSPAAGNDATPTIVVSGVVAGDTVTVSDGTTDLGSKVVPAGATTVTFNAAEAEVEANLAADGDHTLTATATDPAGNTSAASGPFVYFLDTGATGPTLVSSSPDGSSPVRPPASVSATYDEPLDPSSSTITVRNQFGNVIAGATSYSADARTIIFTPSSSFSEAGSPYVVTAEVGDANANLTTSTWSFTVDTTAPSAPTISSVAGDTTSPAIGHDPTPTIVVSDVVAGDTVTVFEGTTVLATKVVPAGADTVTFNAAATDADVTLSGHGDHTLTTSATDVAGNASAASPPFVYTLVPVEGTFHPLAPNRILDTRVGIGAPKAKLGPGATMDLQVTGRGGVPTTGVSAVVMNVTVYRPTSSTSHLTAWPTGSPLPEASNLNYVAGETVPNLVVVKVGTDGKVSLRNDAGHTHVIADVVGWYSDGSGSPGSRYSPLVPNRILDTRVGIGAPKAKLGSGATMNLQVTGRGGVPTTGVSAVVMNVTVTKPTAPSSHLTAWATGSPLPNASNLNYVAGETVPNLVVVKVGTDGKVSLRNNVGFTHVIADVVGYYGADRATAGARYSPLVPNRILDTRSGIGAPKATLGSGATMNLQVTGRGGVPTTGVSAVVMNVTVTKPTAPSSHLTAWPTGSPLPNASNLNYVAGQTVPNLVVVKVGTDGKVSLRNNVGFTHVIADVVGWYDTE